MKGTTQTSGESYSAIEQDILAESSPVRFGQSISMIATPKSCMYIVGRSATMGDTLTQSQLLPGERLSQTDSRMLSPAWMETVADQKVLCCYHTDSEKSLVEIESTTSGYRGGHE